MHYLPCSCKLQPFVSPINTHRIEQLHNYYNEQASMLLG